MPIEARNLVVTDRSPAPPRPTEDRRLKLGGLVLAVVGVGAIGAALDAFEKREFVAWLQALPMASLALAGANLLALGLVLMAVGFGSARTLHDPHRRRAAALQLLLANALAVALLMGGTLDDQSGMAKAVDERWQIVMALAAYGLALIGWRLWRRSRQHEALDADVAMALDPRPPVLYLRSFRDDGVSLAAQQGGAWRRRLMTALQLPAPEEQMARILSRIGPLVAIGKPGEALPELGAARLYVAHDRWQHKVSELMQRAALVVVRVGTSPGVLWEIEQALQHLRRQRLVLVVLGDTAIAPELIARLAPVLGGQLDQALPQPAPQGLQLLRWRRQPRRLGGLVCFDAAGQAAAIAVHQHSVPLWKAFSLGALLGSRKPMELAWQQVFERTLPIQPQGQRHASRALAVVLALWLGMFGAHWFYLGRPRRGWLYVALMPVLLASWFMAIADVLRFVWCDRATFEARWDARSTARRG